MRATSVGGTASVRVGLLALPLLLMAGGALAFQPVHRPRLETARAAGEIRVDGALGDAGWSSAGKADNFSERLPGDNVEPPVRTEAFITYDEDYLYVAFACQDDPRALRATMCQRDMYDNDDAVGVLIDTFGEGTWAYEFFVNPYGIQRDLMWTNIQGEDAGFDMVWDSAARVTADGYTVEMAIPLAGMRFPDRAAQTWRVEFWRNHPRDSYRQYSWGANDRNEQCFPCKWGTVGGIAGISPGKGLELLPSVIAYQTGRIADPLAADSGLDTNDLMGEPSLGAKYSVSSDVTLEGTLNPDFSQIEADADQIDVNTTIVQRYAELRPFFQEGNDLFRTMFNSFYTRMVNDPELATKGTARWDRTSLAYLTARDEHSPYIIPAAERSYTVVPGRSTVNVLRGLHSLGNNSQLGFMATDRRYDEGGAGTILSGDANIRLSRTCSWATQYVWSHTAEPDGFAIDPGETFDDGRHTIDLDGEKYAGNAFITELRRRARAWSFTLDFNQVAPSYRTQTGYDPWNDQRNSFVFTNYNIYFDQGLIERITPGLYADGRWDYDGDRKWAHGQGSLAFRLRRAQTNFGVNYSRGEETWGGVEFADLWSVGFNFETHPHDMLAVYGQGVVGTDPALFTLEKGDLARYDLSLEFKPIDRLIIEPTVSHVRSENPATGELQFRQTIARARVRLQVNPQFSLRLVLQHNSSRQPLYQKLAQEGEFPTYHMAFGTKWEVDPLLTYRLNSFSVFYLGATHDFRDFNAALADGAVDFRMTGRQYFMKLQYLWQM
jgi:hypothetical protein